MISSIPEKLSPHEKNVPIAVIGMALRASGADTPDDFWQNLVNGRDCFTRPTESQLRRAGVPKRLIQNPRFIRSRPVLQNPGEFDAAFFDMNTSTARIVDPGHRMFMTCAWEALERAGVLPGPEVGVVGVYGGGGTMQEGYAMRNFGGGHVDLDDPTVWLPINLGAGNEHLTSRVCFHFNLKGPNISSSAACATSLLSIHLAVRDLRRGDCNLAVAGGSTISAPHWPGYLFVEGGPVSESGIVRPFDEKADGTVFSSGTGAVVLKRLDEALADGDVIHGVILGSGIFNDGGGKGSLAAPGLAGQTEAISRALADADVDARTVGFIESHGTGTLLGDPMEVEAATQVFKRDTDEKQFCALGALKANIGHTATAAGVLALIKACLALQHGRIPPNIHFDTPNPLLDLPGTPFYIPTEAVPWNTSGHPRRAGVSAFGFGGNNAHIVLEEAPAQPKRAFTPRHEVLVLSARTSRALEHQIDRLVDHVTTHPDQSIKDVAYTLQTGRKAFEHRAAVLPSANGRDRVKLESQSFVRGRVFEDRSVVFVFPGQGSQSAGMGYELYKENSCYREVVDRCAQLLDPHLDLDIRSLLGSGDEQAAEKIKQTAYSQPALFVIDYALARCFQAQGVRPAAMLGHSLGELVAACFSGVFTLPDALALVALRGKLMQACDPGAMMAVFLPAEEVAPFLEPAVEIAAYNAPDSTVVSGSKQDIERLRAKLEQEHIGFRLLETSHGFHSADMEPVIKPFREAVEQVERGVPKIPFLSNVTGRFITDEESVDPNYWSSHIRQAVRFTQGVHAVMEKHPAIWLEVGPGKGLSSLLRRQTDGSAVISTLDGERSDDLGFLQALSRLWVEGVSVNWEKAGSPVAGQKVVLPTYPFEYENYWIEPPLFQPEEEVGPGSVKPAEPQDNDFLLAPDWRRESLREPQISSENGWLIFDDDSGLGAELCKAIQSAGARVITLKPGSRFEKVTEDEFKVVPGDRDSLLAVFEEAAETGWQPHRILHLWQLNGTSEKPADPLELFDASLTLGFETLTALVQALHEDFPEVEVQLTVVAGGITKLEGEETEICWEKSLLMGPCRVAPLEIPTLSIQLLDVPALPGAWTNLVNGILAEACDAEPGTLKVLREDGRYLETFQRLGNVAGMGGVREEGVVLITGGVGGLGLELAGRLFEMARMRLALLTRWQPPPADKWVERSQVNDKLGRALRKVLELRERGADVLLVHGQSDNPSDMARVVGEVRDHFGAIHGVIHAAGINLPALILEKDLASAREVLSPKVKGALILEQLLGDTPLDFCIHFSSTASVNPTPGQLDYSSANAVLDALVKRPRPSKWAQYRSVSWDAWQEVGMAVDGLRKKDADVVPDFSDKPAGEPVGHPLLKFCRRENNRVLFSGMLRPGDHWVVDEHRNQGVATLPGTGILELVHAACTHLLGKDSPVVMKDVAFRRFVEVPEDGLVVWLVLREQGEEWAFELRSCLPNAGSQRLGDMTLHSSGSVGPLSETRPPMTIPDVEFSPCPSYSHAVIQFGPHWTDIDLSEATETGTMLQLSLQEYARSEVSEYGLYPSLMDRALGYVPSKRLGGKGIPSTIGELRVYQNLPAHFTVFVQEIPEVAGAASMVITDDRGEIVVEVEDYQQVAFSDKPLKNVAMERKLGIRDVGDLGTLEWVPFELPPPGEGEVQIEVFAAGLNFRDVLTALGGLSDFEADGAPKGGECSGQIVAVGSGVEDFAVGDSVMAVDKGSFATRFNADARLVRVKPPELSFEEAASVPITFLTAEYALNHIGRLVPGERVLIHAAAGGVGLAAIQVALAAGAEIYATAGSEEKRAYLRDLGIQYVMDSRNLDFVEEVRKYTDGTGVDLVLNSLAGEFIPASLNLLRPFGRFLEIGKRDIYQNTAIGLLPFRNNLSLHAIDLGPMIERRHPLLVRMFAELIEAFKARRLQAGPVLSVPWQDTRKAMEHMAAARHIGKVVLVIRPPSERLDGGLSDQENFHKRYKQSIPLQAGLDVFQEVLQSADLPSHLIVTPRSLEKKSVSQDAPSLDAGGDSRDRRSSMAAFRAPTNPLEELMVEIWQQVLSIDSIGIDDDFLALGGDSIASIQILNRIRKKAGVALSNDVLFRYSTPALLCECIQKQESEVLEASR